MLIVLQLGIWTQLAQPAESGFQLGKKLQLGRTPIWGGVTRERFSITTESVWLQGKVGQYNRRFAIRTQGLWLQQKLCEHNKFVNTTEGLRLQQKVCDYNGKNVITTEGLWLEGKVCNT